MTAPMKQMLKLTLSKQIVHGGHPVLRWMAGNVSADSDPAGNLKPNKKTSGGKIDGIVALIMALGVQMVATELFSSIYSQPGALTE